MIKPFSETALFEQGNMNDPFYATGSNRSVGETPGSFSQSLFNKEQIKLSFQVSSKTTMLANSSSIYYFNKSAGVWNLPTKAIGDHVGPFEKFAISTDWNPPSGTLGDGFTRGSPFIEDAKGFDAYGRAVVSGSRDIYRQVTALRDTNSSYKFFGQFFNGLEIKDAQFRPIGNAMDVITEDFPKSVQRSDTYDASLSETFEINIDKPFLLEKALFEVPLCLGKSWFQDRTTTNALSISGTYLPTGTAIAGIPGAVIIDSGGPVLTLSLFCQKKYGLTTVRDLISKGTITHVEDSKLTAVARKLNVENPTGGPFVYVESYGVRNPTIAIRQPAIDAAFTGSIVVKTTANITNGINGVTATVFFLTGSGGIKENPNVYYIPEIIEKYNNLIGYTSYVSGTARPLGLPFSVIAGTFLNINVMKSADSFGRAMTGFSPSGGSIFGGEYVSSQKFNSKGETIIPNPYYSDNTTFAEISNTSTNLYNFFNNLESEMATYYPSKQVFLVNVFNSELFSAEKESPYLLNPGDKLVLAISKTRPAISASNLDVRSADDANTGKNILRKHLPLIGSVTGHDVQLNTGSINITLYGSYVRAGDSYKL